MRRPVTPQGQTPPFWTCAAEMQDASLFQLKKRLQYSFICPKRAGQSTLEYLLALVAIVLAILYAARSNGPIQTAVGKVLTDTSDVIKGAVDASAQRLNF